MFIPCISDVLEERKKEIKEEGKKSGTQAT
jgi:hypothetical protein